MPTDTNRPRGPSRAPLEARRTPVDGKKKEEMLAVLIRNPKAYDVVADMFKVKDCIRSLGGPLGLVWKLVRHFRNTYAELPGKVQIESEIHNALAGNESLLAEEEKTEVDEFLTFAFNDLEHGRNIATSGTHLRVAVATCKEVLEELVTADLQDNLTKEGTLPADVTALLDVGRSRLDQVRSLTDVDVTLAFPEGWDQRPDAALTSTGCATLDAFMGGGWRAGECLLFMAPYGSCKTTLACHATAELIVQCAAQAAAGQVRTNKKGEPMTPVVVLVFTESDATEYRNRLMAHLATVPWKRLAGMTSLADLSTGTPGATDATEYELSRFADAIKGDRKHKRWVPEQTRVRNAVTIANRHLVLVDCTESEDNPHKIGVGGMSEVANVVTGLFRKRPNTYPIAIWIDHLSGLIDRVTTGGEGAELDEGQVRRLLTNMPRVAIERMGKPLRCPVGVFHQFAGAVQNKGVTAKYHHSDAEGSKSIGKYANFAVVCGKVDANLMCQFDVTKHRREPPTATRIVRIDGDFSRLVDCTDTHGVETGRGVIMTREELRVSSGIHRGGAVDVNEAFQL